MENVDRLQMMNPVETILFSSCNFPSFTDCSHLFSFSLFLYGTVFVDFSKFSYEIRVSLDYS